MMTMEETKLRKVEMRGIRQKMWVKGYFHRWCHEPYPELPLAGISQTFALVELEDGTMRFVNPEYIKFLEPLATDW